MLIEFPDYTDSPICVDMVLYLHVETLYTSIRITEPSTRDYIIKYSVFNYKNQFGRKTKNCSLNNHVDYTIYMKKLALKCIFVIQKLYLYYTNSPISLTETSKQCTTYYCFD